LPTKTVFITSVGSGTFTIPADFGTLVAVHCIGGGGAGGIGFDNLGSGGGGGAYARSTSVALQANTTAYFNIGEGGINDNSVYDAGSPGGDTWFNAFTNEAPTVALQGALAKGGDGGIGEFGGAGGSSDTSIGDVKFAGGSGANSGPQRGSHGGGGGAAGPGGVGGDGGAGDITSGGGGSGATLTSAGTAGTTPTGSTTVGGAGGASAGQTGGTGGTSSVAAAAGVNGGGGGGAFNDSVNGGDPYPGGAGGAGSIWTQTSGETETFTVCGTADEDGIVVMTAPLGTVFTSIEFASWGNPTGTCGSFSLGGCHAANTASIVSGYLIGNGGTINIPASNAIFGDPCTGTSKSLYIQATATSTGIAGPGGGLGGQGGQDNAASNGGIYGGGGSGSNTGSGGLGAQGIIVFVYRVGIYNQYQPYTGFFTTDPNTNKLQDLSQRYVTKSYLLDVYPNIASQLGNRTSPGFYAWGVNGSGQLGLGDIVHRSSPVQVGSLTNWKQVAAGGGSGGGGYVAAIKNDGTLWSHGQNTNGQLGLGDRTARSSPVQVGTLTNWKLVSAGQYDTMAITYDGALWAIGGRNIIGALGLNDTNTRSSPVQVGSLTNWKSVTVGGSFSAAVKTDGTIWTWGINTHGQLGLGDRTARSSPVQVGTLTNWRLVNTGQYHTVAIKTDGTLWTWGRNQFGQLGLGDIVHRSSPVQVGSLTNWKLVVGGYYHTAAIKTDGTLWGWGQATNGRLGDGTGTSKSSPIQVGSLTDWRQVAAGLQHGAAVKTDGTLWTWGGNANGQLGDNTATGKTSPVRVGSLTNWKLVDCGWYHTTAISDSTF
jgi:alpha-tubulin suppressor-like RCC1 family protein